MYQYYAPAHYSWFEYSFLEISRNYQIFVYIDEKLGEILTKSQFLVQNCTKIHKKLYFRAKMGKIEYPSPNVPLLFPPPPPSRLFEEYIPLYELGHSRILLRLKLNLDY